MPNTTSRKLVWEKLATAEVDARIGVEQLTASTFEVERAKVFGGWLVYVYHFYDFPLRTMLDYEDAGAKLPKFPPGHGLTFVPDPKHEWDGSSPDFDRYQAIQDKLKRAMDERRRSQEDADVSDPN